MGNSSSTASSSTTTNGEQYDVFISFRGEDTRDGFTSHLYQALHEKQIKTFRDDQLVRGEQISDGLLSAIRESKISVIVFSERYTSSKWCLLELAEIMKYREKKKHIVIPVFYKVEPSDVRKSYKAASAKHKNEWRNFQEENKIEWGPALTEASQLSGIVVPKGRNEAEFVCDIVKDVWNKLNNIRPCDFKELVVDFVGIEKPIEQVVSLLCLGASDFRIIGIWGMGGMGKTTIADKVFHLVSHQFEKPYFAPSVRAQSEKVGGLICLRDKIISAVLKEENLEIGSPSIPQSIKRRLNQKKVLIVLDDVDKLTKWKDLAGGLDRLGLGSRIILTTRDKQVLRNCGVEDDNIYKVDGLNRDEAFQLFCNYAFKQNHPTEDLEDLSRGVVKIAKDVPLFVIVLGSSLYKKSNREWENAVEKFQGNVDHEGFDVLRISYDGLDEEEKGLFLDIACSLVFHMGDDFKPNLLSDRMLSLSALIDKSLVTVENGHIRMHDLLREMGMEIASKNHSRLTLWRHEDVICTLKHNDRITNAVQGILLHLYYTEDKHLISQAIKKMYDLRTLIIKGSVTIGGLDDLPDQLRYLHWKGYPLEVLPSSFNPVYLVELDISFSNIEQLWKGKTHVPKLKVLSLSCCKNLINIPDLSDIPSAVSINLHFCKSLIEIHSSSECRELKQLYLTLCENLTRIPDLSNFPSTESIDLKHCSSLLEIQSREFPKNLHSLNLIWCKNLNGLPSNIHIEGSEFSLHHCISLTEFPHISGNITRLDLSWSGVEEVPLTIQNLSKLESLDMQRCRSLKRISTSICKLKSLNRLDLSDCCELESFPDILERMELKYLNLGGTAIKELPPSIGNLNRLQQLVFSGCKNLERLPKSIKILSKLYSLKLNYCVMLQSLPELPSSLRRLEATNCKQLIQSLPDESEFEQAINCKQLIQSLKDESEFDFCRSAIGSLYFNFINCLKMNQKAVNNLLIFFRDSVVLKIQRMGTEKIISLFERDERKVVEGSIFLPGSEIPEWFSYKNNGSSINIPGLRNDCGRSSYIMGFAVCLVIGFDSDIGIFEFNDVRYDFHIETKDGHKEGFIHKFPWFRMPSRDEFSYSDLIFLGYNLSSKCYELESDLIFLGYNLSSKCYELFQKLDTLLANRGMSDDVGTSFALKCYGARNKVKHCGIQPIYVQSQVMNSDAINQDTCESNDTEETCELHPKRICTEAKDFEGFIDDNSNFNGNNNNSKETAIEELDQELRIGHSSFYDAHMNSVSINQDTGDTSGSNDTAEETCEPHPKRICT